MPPEPSPAWRRLHPVTILRELAGVAWNLVVAVVVLGALEGGGIDRIEVVVPVAFLAVAVGRYASTRYAVTPEAVLWRRGILFRRRLEVPRSRIQNVSAQADVLGRIFGVRTVTISTAGSEGEVQLALVSGEEASFLLADLLGRPPAAAPDVLAPAPTAGGGGPVGDAAPPAAGPPPPPSHRPAGAVGQPPWPPAPAGGPAQRPAPPPVRRLATLPPRGLLLFGLTGRALPTLALALAVTVPAAVVTGSPRSLLFAVFAAAGPVLATLDLFDFELTGEPDRIRVRHGLLRTRDAWARRERVQVVQVERRLVRSALGYETISVATADATVGSGSDLALCDPLAPRGRWVGLAGDLVEPTALAEDALLPISPLARRRRTLRLAAAAWCLAAVVLLVARAAAGWPAAAAAAGVVGVAGTAAAAGLAARAQRLDGYALDEQHLLVRRGLVGSQLWLVRRAKVQSVSLRATPFQRRLGLASLHVDTATVSGAAIVVPDLPRPRAEALAADLAARADQVFLPDGV